MITIGKLSSANHKRNAALAGIFYFMATGTAILAVLLYKPLLDFNNIFLFQSEKNKILIGIFMELLTAISNIGTAVMLFPYLRKYNESLGLAYFSFRFMESVVITFGVICLLTLFTLTKGNADGMNTNMINYLTNAGILKSMHHWAFILGPYIMLSINTFIYSYIFFKTKLVPKKLALMGIIGAVLLLFAVPIETMESEPLQSSYALLLALPIALYEMILAFRLVRNGYNITSEVLKK